MYTRCPYCHTYFKVLAEHLKKAGGQVRCGQCYKVFNSIGNLIEKLPVPLTKKLTEKQKNEAVFSSPPQSGETQEPLYQPANDTHEHKAVATPAVKNVEYDPALDIPPSTPQPSIPEYEPYLRLNRATKTEFKKKKSILLSKKDKIDRKSVV